MNRDSFILYAIHKSAWMSLSNEDAGLLIKAIYAYQTGEPVSLPPVPNAFFTMIKAYLDRDADKWAQTVEKRRQAGAKGGAASGRSRKKQSEANEANASLAKQTKQTEANEANQANPSCIDMSCFDMSLQDPCVGKDLHTHKIYGGACVSGSSRYSQEDVMEAGDSVRREADAIRQEFDQLRDAYKPVRDDGPNAGWPEYQQARFSKGWPGLLFVLDRLQTLIEQDAQWKRGYKEGLRRFLTDRMWEMEPRKDAGQEPELTPEQEEAKRKVAEGRRRYEEKMAKLKEQKRKLGYG